MHPCSWPPVLPAPGCSCTIKRVEMERKWGLELPTKRSLTLCTDGHVDSVKTNGETFGHYNFSCSPLELRIPLPPIHHIIQFWYQPYLYWLIDSGSFADRFLKLVFFRLCKSGSRLSGCNNYMVIRVFVDQCCDVNFVCWNIKFCVSDLVLELLLQKRPDTYTLSERRILQVSNWNS